MVAEGKAEILDRGAFLLASGELYTPNGRPTEHGASAFTNHGCRCVVCVAGSVRRNRIAKWKRQRRFPLDDPWEPLRTRRTAAEVLS
jgi:hypothetical protein